MTFDYHTLAGDRQALREAISEATDALRRTLGHSRAERLRMRIAKLELLAIAQDTAEDEQSARAYPGADDGRFLARVQARLERWLTTFEAQEAWRGLGSATAVAVREGYRLAALAAEEVEL